MSDVNSVSPINVAGVKIKQEPVDTDVGARPAKTVGNAPPTKTADVDEDAKISQLITENVRLQCVFDKLNSRQSVLEEFIELEYGEKYDTFLKNRERLMNVMGLGDGENPGKVDGKRSAKSIELVNLLRLVKNQAASYNSEEGPSTAPSVPQQGPGKRPVPPPPSFNGHHKKGRRGNWNHNY